MSRYFARGTLLAVLLLTGSGITEVAVEVTILGTARDSVIS
jgi:hypothetical protein